MTMPSFHVTLLRSTPEIFLDLIIKNYVQESKDERRARLDEKI